MIHEGQIYKTIKNDLNLIPVGDLIQILDSPSTNRFRVIHYKYTSQKSFLPTVVNLTADQITCFMELVFDLKSLVPESPGPEG